jgi:enoyl-CoA hydratase/carnithine racemase
MAQVLHTLEGQVATIVLANEAKYNAMSLGMWQQLGALLDQLGQDESVRVLVLRGQGDKAFVSGADIAEFEQQRSNPDGVAAYDRAVDQVQTALAQFPRPVIAAISGICFGGGLGMALSCDLRYCSAGSRFRMPAARLGLGYAWRGMRSLVGALGAMNAAEAFFTARIYSAEQALKLGIVQSVHEDVFAHAQQTAALIAENAPLTIAAAKQAMVAMRAGDASAGADVARVDAAVARCFASQDYIEGRMAFAEKRPPQFRGQ